MLKKFNGGDTDNFLTSGLINCGVFLKPHSTTEITTATHNNIMNLTMIVKSSPIWEHNNKKIGMNIHSFIHSGEDLPWAGLWVRALEQANVNHLLGSSNISIPCWSCRRTPHVTTCDLKDLWFPESTLNECSLCTHFAVLHLKVICSSWLYLKLNGLTSLANDIDGMYTKEIFPLRRKMSLGEGCKRGDFASFVGRDWVSD